MANDLRMLEGKNYGIDEKRKDREENELCLELSIGGIYGKSEKLNRIEHESEELENNNAEDALNSQAKGEIEFLRRQEVRRKREEKLMKSEFGSCGSEAQIRVRDREIDDILEIEPARKKEKIRNSPENMTVPVTNGFVKRSEMPVATGVDENCVLRRTSCRSFRPYQVNMNLNSGEDEMEGGGKVNSNGSWGSGSSAFSGSRSSSRQGGSTDDSRSNSSHSQLDQQLASSSAASDPLNQSDHPNGSSNRTTAKLADSALSEVEPPAKSDQENRQASLLTQMPCVSTTGNGPNGKTVSGFLYRYTKTEVSIVCVCHGSSFSPAGFVEHAGGVDIVNPLKHITIFPSASGF